MPIQSAETKRSDSAPRTVAAIAERLGIGVPQLTYAASRAERDHRPALRATGRKNRLLRVPSRSLMEIQRAINERILADIALPDSVFGCRGRGVKQNVEAHALGRYVYVLDIRDAFPSVGCGRVKTALMAAGFDPAAAGLLTRLCTAANQLPQGAPTSNSLLNLVLAPLDQAIENRAAELGARYTRYVDDVCISGPEPLTDFVQTVERQLADDGFVHNSRKSRHWGPNSSPVITGVAIRAGKLRPVPEFLRGLSLDVRAAVQARRNALSRTQLLGRIAWAKYLDPDLGRSFERAVSEGARNHYAARRRSRCRSRTEGTNSTPSTTLAVRATSSTSCANSLSVVAPARA